ncbi:MAG: GGDEF domain-containing protein [Deltaproteobacteria bacterium]|nr:GGDEF domain-containing protein [Deltaproteobacteria bacterium]
MKRAIGWSNRDNEEPTSATRGLPDDQNNHFGIIAIILIVITVLLLTGARALLYDEISHALVLISFAFATTGTLAFSRFDDQRTVPSNCFVLLMTLFCFYVLTVGGDLALWCFVHPLLVLFLFGLKKGLKAIAVLFILSIAVLFGPRLPFVETEYPLSFSLRFIGALLSVSLLSAYYEYSKSRSHRRLQALSERLYTLSRSDELTRISNRRDMLERLKQEALRSDCTGLPFSVVLGDIDHFKQINDERGHECGDMVLQAVAGALSESIRGQDAVARWGGEEFLMLLPATKREEALVVSERLRQSVQATRLVLNNTRISVTMSFGVSTACPGESIQDVIRNADRNLYQAKENGRNSVHPGMGIRQIAQIV